MYAFAKEQGEVLDRHLKKILNHTPKIQDVPHVFYSQEAHANSGGKQTFEIKDEFGNMANASFVGGVSIGSRGRIIPATDEEELSASAESYEFLGYLDEKGVLIRSDHTPEIPQYYVDTVTPEEEDFEL